METTAIASVMVTIFLWGVFSARFERADLTAPIVFVAVGALLARLGLVNGSAAPATLRPLVEVTLVWVLFSDAARVRVRDLREDLGRCLRLLGIGLPLTVLAGWGLAAWFFPQGGVWLSLLVGAALAPTDAALGVPVVTNPVVPARIRRLITVESGLNDGVVAPVVVLALAGAAAAEGTEGAPGVGSALVELAIGVAVGVAAGVAGGALVKFSRGKGWSAEDFAGIAVLALALAAYTVALATRGNGFIAAFVAGLTFGAAAGTRGTSELMFLEQTSGLFSLLVWMLFGATAVPIMLERINMTSVAYAVLSLTVVRMVPVALASLGTGLDRRTILFVGWFGPRGLASLVFALLALEQLGSAADMAVSVIAVTVLLSVITHGASAGPLAARYGRAAQRSVVEPSGGGGVLPVRGLPGRSRRHRGHRSSSR
jgi:sodium/hydrogen antiporter